MKMVSILWNSQMDNQFRNVCVSDCVGTGDPGPGCPIMIMRAIYMGDLNLFSKLLPKKS